MKKIWLSAIVCLGVILGDATAEDIGKFKEALSSADAEVRSDACLALIEERKKAIPLLAPRLRDRSMLVRHCAAYALSRIGGLRVEEIFKDGLKAPGSDLRRISALGLGMLGKADLKGLLPLLSDKNWEVRWSAAFALGRSGERRSLGALGKTARNDPYYDSKSGTYPVRAAAEKAIIRLNSMIGWQTDLKRAIALSRADDKPLFLYFRRSGSDLCRQFERDVFTEEKIVDVAQRFIPVWLDHLANPGAFKRYGTERVPVILLAAPDGSRLGTIDGTIAPAPLLDKMLAALEGEKSTSRLRARMKISPPNLETAWQLSECYMQEGQWDSATRLLELIIKNDPDNRSSLVDNALFARAYIQGKLGNYSLACREFKDLLDSFPAFGDRAEAMYCWGLSALQARQIDEGEKILQRLRKEYPDSNFAGIAEDILVRLNAGRGEKNPK